MSELKEGPILTLDEMRQRYDGEWVLIVDYEVDPESYEVARGRVIAHSPDREDVHRVDRRLRPRDAAYHCFQDPGGGTGLVL